jgi:hypothetical protein
MNTTHGNGHILSYEYISNSGRHWRRDARPALERNHSHFVFIDEKLEPAESMPDKACTLLGLGTKPRKGSDNRGASCARGHQQTACVHNAYTAQRCTNEAHAVLPMSTSHDRNGGPGVCPGKEEDPVPEEFQAVAAFRHCLEVREGSQMWKW